MLKPVIEGSDDRKHWRPLGVVTGRWSSKALEWDRDEAAGWIGYKFAEGNKAMNEFQTLLGVYANELRQHEHTRVLLLEANNELKRAELRAEDLATQLVAIQKPKKRKSVSKYKHEL